MLTAILIGVTSDYTAAAATL